MNKPLWGIDLGGTKIEGVILESIAHTEPIIRTRIDTEAAKGYEHIVGQIGALVTEMKKIGAHTGNPGHGYPRCAGSHPANHEKQQYHRIEWNAFEKRSRRLPAITRHHGQ